MTACVQSVTHDPWAKFTAVPESIPFSRLGDVATLLGIDLPRITSITLDARDGVSVTAFVAADDGRYLVQGAAIAHVTYRIPLDIPPTD